MNIGLSNSFNVYNVIHVHAVLNNNHKVNIYLVNCHLICLSLLLAYNLLTCIIYTKTTLHYGIHQQHITNLDWLAVCRKYCDRVMVWSSWKPYRSMPPAVVPAAWQSRPRDTDSAIILFPFKRHY